MRFNVEMRLGESAADARRRPGPAARGGGARPRVPQVGRTMHEGGPAVVPESAAEKRGSQMPESVEVDVLVIGAGTGGVGVANRCARAGLSVAIVDERPYGGTCALRGCDPKKMLVGVTDVLDWARRMTGRGIGATGLHADWGAMMAFKRSFTENAPGQIEGGLQKAGVHTLHARARFVGPTSVVVEADTTTLFKAGRIHLASGARPRALDVPGEAHVITSTDFLDLDSLPPRICFIGGGYISFEFSHVARRAGAEEVTIVHQGRRPLEGFDPDLVERLVERTRSLGVDVRLGSRVTAVTRKRGRFAARHDGAAGERAVACDLVVHGAGRVPNLQGMGLDVAGVAHGARGVRVTRALRSVTNPSVWAGGDAADTGGPALTPVSSYDARVAAMNIIANEDLAEVDYPAVPSIVFTVPPLARVGMLEQEARASGLEYDVHHEGDTSGWYSSMRVAEGWSGFKVLVEKRSGRILGAHFLGPGAEEQVNVLAVAMQAGLAATELKGAVFAYPSFSSDVASML